MRLRAYFFPTVQSSLNTKKSSDIHPLPSKPNNCIQFLRLLNEKYVVFKSSKLSKQHIKPNILYYKNNIISYDHRGTIFLYSNVAKKKIPFTNNTNTFHNNSYFFG